jgi:hypothetical protein
MPLKFHEMITEPINAANMTKLNNCLTEEAEESMEGAEFLEGQRRGWNIAMAGVGRISAVSMVGRELNGMDAGGIAVEGSCSRSRKGIHSLSRSSAHHVQS